MFEYVRVSPFAATLASPAPGREQVEALQARIRAMQATGLETRGLATHPAIAGLLPGGAVQAGATYSVQDSMTLVMAMLAGPSAAGAWCAVIGMPDFGAEAAARFGIDLQRLVLIPSPGDQWLAVTAAVVDVVTVVVVQPDAAVSDAAAARLSGRLRARGATLIVCGPWPRTEATLTISESRWGGLGQGHGYLSSRQVTVRVAGARGVPRGERLWLPDAEEKFRAGRHSP